MDGGLVLPTAESVNWDLTVSFNEVECRDFICRVGRRVVPRYGFTIGIEEVYAIIDLRYGPAGISDAISVFHEMLDSKDIICAGLGADSDIWAAWKDRWRRRNADALDPWIPRAAGIIFPPATPHHIRRIRAQNFLRGPAQATDPGAINSQQDGHSDAGRPHSSSQVPSSASIFPGAFDDVEDDFEDIPVYAHQRYRTLQNQRELNNSSNEDHVEVRRLASVISRRPTLSDTTSTTDLKAHSASFETPELNPAATQAWLALTAAPTSPRSSSDGQLRAGQLLPASRYVTGSERAESCYPLTPKKSDSQLRERVRPSSESLSTHDLDNALRFLSEKEAIIIDTEHCQNDRHSTTDLSEQQLRIQRAHRNAALLNGSIRTPVEFSDQIIHELPGDQSFVGSNNDSSDFVARSTSFSIKETGSVIGVKVKKSRKQRFFGFFRLRHNKEKIPSANRRPLRSQSTSSLWCSFIHEREDHPPSSQETRPRLRPMTLPPQLDGAWSPLSTASSSYLNKPLPLEPEQFARASRRTQSSSPTRLPSRSTASQVLNISSKKEFRAITRDLLRQENMQNSPRLLSPDRSRIPGVTLEPKKFYQGPPSPLSFSDISNGNPFHDAPIPISPRAQTPRTNTSMSYEDVPPVPSLPSSRSEPSFYDRSPSQLPLPGHYDVGASGHSSSSSPSKPSSDFEEARGRSRSRTQTPTTNVISSQQGSRSPSKSNKRSRSPVKRLLGLAKTTPKAEHTTTTANAFREPTPASSTKRSLKEWGYKIKNGFIAADNEEQERESHIEEYHTGSPIRKMLPPSTFPISLDPSYQARLIADVELMLVISANRFLTREATAGRISRHSIEKFRRDWEAKNLAQVVEYQFDQGTQRAIILDNLRDVRFCGEIGNNPIALTAALHAWGIMVKEMNVRTFCAGDSVIRKWLNDTPRILEMLGAPYITFSTFEKIQTKTQLVIGQRQRHARQAEDQNGEEDFMSGYPVSNSSSRQPSGSSYAFRGPSGHIRSVSNDSYIHGAFGSMTAQLQAIDAMPFDGRNFNQASSRPQEWRPVTPAPSAGSLAYESTRLPRDAYENSRGGRLGLVRNATPGAVSPQGYGGFREL